MMNRSSILILASVAVMSAITTLTAQTTFIQRRYGGPSSESCGTMIRTSDGGFLIVGSSDSYVGGPRARTSGYVVKTDVWGIQQWTRSIGTASVTVFFAARQMPDGGYLLLGDHGSTNVTYTLYMARLDASGALMWDRSITNDSVGAGDNGLYGVSAVALANNGSFYVGGQSWRGRSAYWKLDTLGNAVWMKAYGGTAPDPQFDAHEYALGLRELPEGGVIATGYTDATVAGDIDAYLLRLDANGDSLWWHSYGLHDAEIESNEYGLGVARTADGGFLVVGMTGALAVFGSGENTPYILRVDGDGTLLRSSTIKAVDSGLTGPNMSFASLAPMSNGHFMGVGTVADWAGHRVPMLAEIGDDGRLLRSFSVGDIYQPAYGSTFVPITDSTFAVAGSVTVEANTDMLFIYAGAPRTSGTPMEPGKAVKLDLTDASGLRGNW